MAARCRPACLAEPRPVAEARLRASFAIGRRRPG
jgi:hypothetical protein